MKKLLFIASAMTFMASCAGDRALVIGDVSYVGETTEVKISPLTPGCPEYVVVNNPQVRIEDYPVDKEGYYVIFNGNEKMQGWRGYGKDHIPSKWIVEDGCLKFDGTGEGDAEGGDLIFDYQFSNFILELEWKVAKGGNSGIFYLAREVKAAGRDGVERYQPIFMSAPEYQVLDNANHPDAKLGIDGNRQSSSLYDMIPANPQLQNPYGEWNKATIIVCDGKVTHRQNDSDVLEYHMWTPEWSALLNASKFSEKGWPLAYELLNYCGGEARQGYIGIQDHEDDVWFRNIRVKILPHVI